VPVIGLLLIGKAPELVVLMNGLVVVLEFALSFH
jgi:hypothetical protein